MTTSLDITRIQSLNEAIVMYEKLSAEKEIQQDHIKALLRYVFKTFKTRKARGFLWEVTPDHDVCLARQVGQWT